MDLELHQPNLRYEDLRSRSPRCERRLLSSLTEVGQQMPIVVVMTAADGHIVIDGSEWVGLRPRSSDDTVRATSWELGDDPARHG
jgi:hypothetical protein